MSDDTSDTEAKPSAPKAPRRAKPSAAPLGRLPRLNRSKKASDAGRGSREAPDAASAETRARGATPASPAAGGDTFIDEVTEELRRERLYAALRRYGPYALGAAVALVIGAAVVEWRRSAAEEAARAAGGALIAVEEQGPEAAGERADALLGFAAGADAGPALVARLRAAELRRQAGDADAAVALYREIAAETDLAPRYADLAVLKAAMIDSETAEPDTVLDALAGAAAPGRPYRALALELSAAQQLRKGGVLEARRALAEAQATPNLPQGAASRIAQLLEALGGPPPPPTPVGAVTEADPGADAAAEPVSDPALGAETAPAPDAAPPSSGADPADAD